MYQKRDEFEIDLQKLLFVYMGKWWLFCLCVLVTASIALMYTKFYVTPMYRASVTVYVNNIRSGEQIDYLSSSNLAASQQLVNTYINIIKSNTVLEQVVELSALNCDADDVRDIMSTSRVDETEMFQVHIAHPDPEMAARIANAVANVAPGEIEQFVEGSSAKIIDYAKVPEHRYSPSYSRNVFFGGMIGGILAAIYVTVRYLLDVRIKEESDLAQLFDYPVLGQIPVFEQVEGKRRSGYSRYAYAKHSYETQEEDRQKGGEER